MPIRSVLQSKFNFGSNTSRPHGPDSTSIQISCVPIQVLQFQAWSWFNLFLLWFNKRYWSLCWSYLELSRSCFKCVMYMLQPNSTCPWFSGAHSFESTGTIDKHGLASRLWDAWGGPGPQVEFALPLDWIYMAFQSQLKWFAGSGFRSNSCHSDPHFHPTSSRSQLSDPRP